VPGARQRLAVGKKNCRESGTRQILAVSKGGRRDGGHLPSAFSERPAIWLSAKNFFIFLKFFTECQGWHLANYFFYFF
jgi:hypothetical protein